MDKNTFIESIEAIKKQEKYDNKVAKYLGKAFPDAFEANLRPNNSFILNQLIKILQIENNDFGDSNSWIDYFCYELDFGKEYKAGMVTDKNDKNIDISTPEKLWEFLNKK